MDHLPIPIDGVHPAVPMYAQQKVYQPGDFFDIPHNYMKMYGYQSLDDLIYEGLKINENITRNQSNGFIQS